MELTQDRECCAWSFWEKKDKKTVFFIINSVIFAIISREYTLIWKRSIMEKSFEEIKQEFINASLDEKIKLYTSTQGLTVEQFKELLAYFPIKHLDKLEEAVNGL